MTMTIEQQYFIDVIQLMPEHSIIFIQAPSLELEPLLRIMSETKFPYYKSIALTGKSRELLIAAIGETSILEDFQSFEIWNSGTCLFKGFDGAEIGEISRDIYLPESFTQKYIVNHGMCSFLN